MNKPENTRDVPREPQPWHAADEKPSSRKQRGAPIGTHSFTGGAETVGMPVAPRQEDAERSTRGVPAGAGEPDPLAEPRAPSGDLLGSRHETADPGEGKRS
jgi:hypothetical protein